MTEQKKEDVPFQQQPPQPPADEIDLLAIVAFLIRSWRFMLAGAILGALAMLPFFFSHSYQASVTLLFSASLSPQNFQKVLESDLVVEETLAGLRQEGVCDSEQKLRVGKDLQASVGPGGSSQPSVLLATVTAINGEKATQIANAWVKVFLAKAKELVDANTRKLIAAMEKEPETYKEEVKRLEDERAVMEEKYVKDESALSVDYEKKMGEVRAVTADLLGKHQQETARLLSAKEDEKDRALAEFKNKHANFDERESHLKTLNKRLAALKEELAQAENQLAEKSAQAAQVRTPAPSAEIHSTITEEPSPRQAELPAEVENLKARVEQTQADVERMSKEKQAGEAALRDDQTELAKIEREFDYALDSLRQTRELAWDEEKRKQTLSEDLLSKEKASRLASLKREWMARLDQVKRNIEMQNDLYDQSMKACNKARAQKLLDDSQFIQVAAKAVPPELPVARNLLLKTACCAFAGAFLGVLFALGREVARKAGSQTAG